jgi:hypothetical protein
MFYALASALLEPHSPAFALLVYQLPQCSVSQRQNTTTITFFPLSMIGSIHLFPCLTVKLVEDVALLT